jgi:predicted nucleic acid-binding protein
LADVSLSESLELAAQYNLYAYDAFVIQCARRYGTRLLSLDANLVRVAQDVGISALEVDG